MYIYIYSLAKIKLNFKSKQIADDTITQYPCSFDQYLFLLYTDRTTVLPSESVGILGRQWSPRREIVFPFFLYSSSSMGRLYGDPLTGKGTEPGTIEQAQRIMEFYDVGSSDLRELWESYLSEPVSISNFFIIFNINARSLIYIYIYILRQNENSLAQRKSVVSSNQRIFLVPKTFSLTFFPFSPSLFHPSSQIYSRTKSIPRTEANSLTRVFYSHVTTRKCSFSIGERTRGEGGIGKTRVSRFYFLLLRTYRIVEAC